MWLEEKTQAATAHHHHLPPAIIIGLKTPTGVSHNVPSTPPSLGHLSIVYNVRIGRRESNKEGRNR